MIVLDRARLLTTMASLYCRESDPRRNGYWNLDNLQTKRWKTKSLKTNYIWHKINTSQLQSVHNWIKYESTNTKSKYFKQLNHRVELENAKELAKSEHDVMIRRHWDLLATGICHDQYQISVRSLLSSYTVDSQDE